MRNHLKQIVASADDINYLQKELLPITSSNTAVDTIKGKECKIYYTQQNFEKEALKLQHGNHSIKKMGICLLADSLLKEAKKIKQEIYVVLRNGNDKTTPLTILTLSAT